MKPRVVFDTNVVVSAVLNTQAYLVATGRPSLCLAFALAGRAQIVVSWPMLAEYEGVLLRPRFGLPEGRVRRLLAIITENAHTFEPVVVKRHLVADPDDAVVLGTAKAGKVDFLVTGNVRHFPRKTGRTRIVTPDEFLIALGFPGRRKSKKI